MGTCGGNYASAIKIFVDYNRNGVFTDAGETVYTSAASVSGAHTEIGSFAILGVAVLGNTVMRIVNVETATPSSISSCGTYSYGETEDYTVNIQLPPYKSQWISMNTGAATWCAGETRSVTVTVKNVGSSTWTSASPQINLGCKWDGDADYFVRVSAGGLASGNQQTYTFNMIAPAAGTNHLSFDIVNEGSCWFGTNTGTCGPGNVISTSSAITINALPVITAQPVNAAICVGGSQNVGVTATGAGLIYQWQYNSGTWNNVINETPAGSTYTNSTSATMNVSGITIAGEHLFRNIVSGSCTPPVTSNTGVLTISTTPSIVNAAPSDFFMDKGASINITGDFFIGASSVTFGGIAATSFIVNSATQITALFPAGNYTTNTLSIITPCGNVSSTTVLTASTRDIIPVGGGTDFHTTIKSALDGLYAWKANSAFTSDITIDVYTGSYTTLMTNGIIEPNINLNPQTTAKLIIHSHNGESPVIDATGKNYGFYNNGLNYIVLNGFDILNAAQDNIYCNGSNIEIAYNRCRGAVASSGIRLINSVSGSSLHHNLFYNNKTYGIYLVNSHNTNISNNTCSSNGYPVSSTVYNLQETFSDGNYSANPAWTSLAGSWNAGNNLLQENPGSIDQRIYTPCNQDTGTWELKFKFDDVNANDLIGNFNTGFRWYLLYKGNADPNNDLAVGYYVFMNPNTLSNYFKLIRDDGVTTVELISTTFTPDYNQHNLKVTRTASGGFNVLLDGVSKGVVTDNTYTGSQYIGFRKTSDGADDDISYDDILAYQITPTVAGAGLYVQSGASNLITNNVLAAKAATGDQNVAMKSDVAINSSSGYNTYYNNGNTYFTKENGINYNNITTWNSTASGNNDIDTDPLFVSTTSGSEDFHEKSNAPHGSYSGGAWPPVNLTGGTWTTYPTYSTAINAGNPSDAYLNELWMNGSRINQGCFGNTPQASESACIIIAPTIAGAARCSTGTVILSAGGAGVNEDYKWYSASTGGTLLQTSGSSYTTPSITSTTTYYVSKYNTITDCETNPRTAVTATINAFPVLPTVTPNGNCGTGTVTLNAGGASGSENYKWYSASTGGTLLQTNGASYTTPSISTTTTYYVSKYNTSSLCEGARSAIVASIYSFPTTPSVTDNSRCDAGVVVLNASGAGSNENYKWYAASTGGVPLQTNGAGFNTPSISATTTFYVTLYNTITGCESTARIPVVATIYITPAVSSITPASRCGTGSVTLSATGVGANENYLWYANASGGTPLQTGGSSFTTPSITSTTTYYVVKINSVTGCETNPRTAVVATINYIPAVPIAGSNARCGTGIVTISASGVLAGEDYKWYSASTGGTLLQTNGVSYTTPSITTTTTYYVSKYNTTTLCEGNRTAVTATVNSFPTAPSVTNGSTCDVGTVVLVASGASTNENYKWYSALTGGSLLQTNGASYTTPSISATTTYFVTFYNTVTTCETTTRTSVVANVYTTPNVSSTTPASRCGTGSVTLGATSTVGTINWYDLSTGGTLLGSGTSFITPIISSTTIYFAEANNNGCNNGTRLSVTAIVNPVPSNPTGTSASRCDAGTVTLTANAGMGTINWYTDSIGGSPVASGTSYSTPVLTSTTTFYVEGFSSGCPSAGRTPVIATINITPNITSTLSANHCGPGVVNLSATSSGGQIYWYSSSSGGAPLYVGSNFSPSVSSTALYYVEAKNNGCTNGFRISVAAIINSIPSAPTAFSASRCDSGVVALSATGASSGEDYIWFTDADETIVLQPAGNSFSTPGIASTTTYYVAKSNNATGCFSTPGTPAIATINETPSILNSTSGSLCDAGSIILNTTTDIGTVNWYNALNGGLLIATGNSYTTPVISSTTVYYAEANNNGCLSSPRIAVTAIILSHPSVDAGQNKIICQGDSVILTATGSDNYVWSYGNLQSNSITVFPASTSTYYVSTTNSDNCTATDSVIVNVKPIPNVPVVSNNGPVCLGNLLQLNASSNIGSTYFWTGPDGFVSTVQNPDVSQFVTTSMSGIYSVNATLNGCISQNGLTSVTVNPVPFASASANTTTSFCAGGYVTLNANQGAYQYNWLQNGVPINYAINNYYIASASGYYSVVLTNVFGCTNTSELIQVSSHDLPLANAGPDISVQTGNNAVVIGNASGGSVPYSYSWFPTSYIANGANSQSMTTSNLTSTTVYSLTVTDSEGCSGSDNMVVNVTSSEFFVNVSASQYIVCSGSPIQLNALVTGGSGNQTYSWSSSPAGFVSTLSDPVAYPTEPAVYSVTVTDGANVSTSGIIINVNAAPNATINITGNTSFCEGGSVILYANSGTNLIYQWKNSGVDIFGANLFNLNATDFGIYSLVITNENGCISTSDSVNVTVFSSPVANAGLDISIPIGTSTYLNGSVSGGTAPYTVLWDPSIYMISGVNTLTPHTDSLNISRFFTLQVTDINGCQSSDIVNVTVYGGALNAFPYASQNIICEGQQIQLYALASGGSGTYSYLWSSFPAGFSSTETNPTVSPLVNTVFTLAVDDGINIANSNIQITVNAVTSATITYSSPVSFCYGSSVNLSANTGTGLTYQWKKDGLNISGANTSLFTANISGNYTVEITNTNSCTSTSQLVYVDVITLPVVNVITYGNTVMCQGDSIILEVDNSNATFQWNNFGSQISAATQSVYFAHQSGVYNIVVTDQVTGCANSSSTVTVTVNQNPIPTIANNGVLTSCTNDTIVLSSVSSYQYYLWSTGEIGQSIQVFSPQFYTLTVTDNNGCTGVIAFNVTDSIMAAPAICIVLVDSTINKNLVVWEKQITGSISYYKIYRETFVAGTYEVIESLPYEHISMFIDTASHPSVKADRYKLSSVDTCGNETNLSSHHRTLHLVISPATPSGYNLEWNDPYEGFEFYSYRIYRRNSITGWSELGLIQSTLVSYTDINPPAGTISYAVAAIKPTGYCIPTGIAKDMGGPFIQSISNVEDDGIIMNNPSDFVSNNINLYPNPVRDELNIEISGFGESKKYEIMNIINQVLYSSLVEKKATVDMRSFAKGVYLLKLYNNKSTIIKRFVKQ